VSFIDEPASVIRDLVASRQVSAREVLAAARERAALVNPVINAVVTFNDRADAEAQAVDDALTHGDRPGPLCGLPVGIKDVTPVAGVRTTYGSPMHADHVPDADALVVRRLRQAGAVILGKTNCPEFAAGGNTFNEVFGRTRNPWNPARSAGGSTGGGAAALATGIIALAEGTDLGGSLRIPASFCGLVGLRPSVGLVPTVPSDWVWDTLQVTGPMARTPGDVALMLEAIAGPSRWAPLAQPVSGRRFCEAAREPLAHGIRVAYVADPVRIGIDAGIDGLCREATFGLRDAAVQVEEIDVDVSSGKDAFLALRGLWFATHMYTRLDRRAEFGPNVAGNVRSGLETSVERLAKAEMERGRLWHLCRDLFGRVDALLTPTMAVPPFSVEQNYPETIAGVPMSTYVDWIAPTFVWSLTGLPVASVPAGRDADGLPVGLQIIGPPFGEERVLAIAAEISRRRPIGLPDIARLQA